MFLFSRLAIFLVRQQEAGDSGNKRPDHQVSKNNPEINIGTKYSLALATFPSISRRIITVCQEVFPVICRHLIFGPGWHT